MKPVNHVLEISPAQSTSPGETHSALVLSQTCFSGDLTFDGSICTIEQLRVGSAPNPWETGWLVWNYTDNDHFYYFSLKPNGWELGKRDPAYEGGQRFLATGDSVSLEMGAWTRFSVVQTGGEMRVSLDGAEVVRFVDLERPYEAGRLGVYSEDARVLLDDVDGVVKDDFDQADAGGLSDGDLIGGAWQVAFLGYGSGAIAARPDAPDIAGSDPPPAAEVAAPAPAFIPDLAALGLPDRLGWLFN
jgi:hypothetical protein